MNFGKMLVILLITFCAGFITQLSKAQTFSSLNRKEGDLITLSCSLAGNYTFPEWRGPPSLTQYTEQNNTSDQFNTTSYVASRLSYAANNRDLLLAEAKKNDAGDYQCSYTGLGNHTVRLTVTEKTAETTESNYKISPGVYGATIYSVILFIGIYLGLCHCLHRDTDDIKSFIRDYPLLFVLSCIIGVGLGMILAYVLCRGSHRNVVGSVIHAPRYNYNIGTEEYSQDRIPTRLRGVEEAETPASMRRRCEPIIQQGRHTRQHGLSSNFDDHHRTVSIEEPSRTTLAPLQYVISN